jgi:membrane-associated phospholipid phosphatase
LGAGLLFRANTVSPGGEPDLSTVFALDRPLMAAYNGAVDLASDFSLAVAVAAPAALVLGREIVDVLTIAVMYTETIAIAQGLKETLKGALPRYRPYVYSAIPGPDMGSDEYASFPSGHTTIAFASAAFLASVMAALEPDSPWTPPAAVGSFLLAGATAVLRMAAGQHFLTDVLAGAALGSLVGSVVPLVHRRNDKASPDGHRTAVRLSVGFR